MGKTAKMNNHEYALWYLDITKIHWSRGLSSWLSNGIKVYWGQNPMFMTITSAGIYSRVYVKDLALHNTQMFILTLNTTQLHCLLYMSNKV